MGRFHDSRIRARARAAVLAEGFAASASASLAWTPHAPHGATIYAGLDSEVTVGEPGGAPVRGRVVVVPPDRQHAATCPGPAVALLFDPENASSVATYARARGSAFPLEARERDHLAAALMPLRAGLSQADVLDGIAREAGTRLAAQAPGRDPDPRVARLLERLRAETALPIADPDPDPFEAADPERRARLWRRPGISPAHLRALFVRDVGLPIRSFQLWHRLLVGVATFARVNATTSAHAAGFSDLAHFSRTSSRFLGASPTALARALL
jgi:AraC-like DNA-binding protein